jgi:hypothetical protein
MTALDLLAIAGVVSVPASISLGVAWWSARQEIRHLRELTRSLIDSPERGGRPANRRELVQAVDEIALEVERLAEGQRYVARLLAERSGDERLGSRGQSGPPPRVITPH